MTFIPRLSEAFNSITRSLNKSPNNCRAAASIVLVLPVPGGPCKSKFGRSDPDSVSRRTATTSVCSTTSSTVLGRLENKYEYE